MILTSILFASQQLLPHVCFGRNSSFDVTAFRHVASTPYLTHKRLRRWYISTVTNTIPNARTILSTDNTSKHASSHPSHRKKHNRLASKSKPFPLPQQQPHFPVRVSPSPLPHPPKKEKGINNVTSPIPRFPPFLILTLTFLLSLLAPLPYPPYSQIIRFSQHTHTHTVSSPTSARTTVGRRLLLQIRPLLLRQSHLLHNRLLRLGHGALNHTHVISRYLLAQLCIELRLLALHFCGWGQHRYIHTYTACLSPGPDLLCIVAAKSW